MTSVDVYKPDLLSAADADKALVRAIGLRRLTASIVNTTIGAGIFVLPAVAASGLGAAAPFAYAVCAVAMALIITCFAAAGSRVSLTGGLYAYVETAFGPLVGSFAGVLFCLTALFADASVSSAFVGSIGVIWPVAETGILRAALVTVLFVGLTAVNIRGVGSGARLMEGATAAKLIPLLVFVAVGVWFVRGDYLAPGPAPTPAQVGASALILIYAFVGVEIALTPSGEIANPSRTVPRALFFALCTTTLLYALIQTVAQGLLGPSLAVSSAAPLAEAAGRVMGRAGRWLMLGGATISMFGYLCGDMLSTPRAVFALARDGLLPRRLAAVHARYRTPYVAIVVYAAAVAVASISGGFVQLAILANVAILSLYLLCVSASYELQRRDVRTAGSPFVLPAGPLVPLLAAIVILWLLSHAAAREFAFEALALGGACLLHIARRRRRLPARSASSDR